MLYRVAYRTLTFALLLLVACTGSIATIVVDRTAETTVEEGTVLEELVGGLGFGSFVSMDITSASELENQGVAPGDIQEVFLTDFTLEVTTEGADFEFLESMELYVESPGLPRALVASSTSFGADVTFVEFDIEDLDLTDYVVSESLTLTTEVTGRRPEVDTTIEAYFALDIGVTSQGLCAAIENS